jgi:hypothetical protein
LWFDLMFDVQALGHGGGELPEAVLASIAGYYRRVTTDARPMNRLIATVMLATLLAIALQLVGDDAPRWVSAVSVVAAVAPVGLAGVRTVPAAVRLGSRSDPIAAQGRLVRTILREHCFCFASIAALLVMQLVWA